MERFMGAAMLAGVLGTSALIGACGGTLQSSVNRQAEAAIAEHLRDSGQFEPGELVVVPRSVAWNRLVEAIGNDVPVRASDYDGGRVHTQWSYEPVSERPGQNVQRRQRYDVQLQTGDGGTYRVDVAATAETRQRQTCADPTAWSRASASSDDLERNLREAVSALREIDTAEIPFPGTREDLVQSVADVILRRWGFAPSPNGIGFPLHGGWRETVVDGDARVAVRSSITVDARTTEPPPSTPPPSTPRPLLQEAVAEPAGEDAAPDSASSPGSAGVDATPSEAPQRRPTTTFQVTGTAQVRGDDGEQSTLWENADDSVVESVVADFFARFAERVPPLSLIRDDVPPLRISNPEAVEPEIPMPPDALSGHYELYIRAVIAPETDSAGNPWDPAAPVAGMLVRFVPHIARAVRLAMTGDVSVLEPYLQYAMGQEPELDATFRRLGARVNELAAPDMALALGLPGGGVSIELGNDTYISGSTEPLGLDIDGDAPIAWILVDRDVNEPDTIAQGRISLSELANACHEVCSSASGARVCLELRRSPSSVGTDP